MGTDVFLYGGPDSLAWKAYRLLKGCIRLSYLKLELHPKVSPELIGLHGFVMLKRLRGLKEVVIQGYDNSSLDPNRLHDVKCELAEELRKALLTPRPVCRYCERGGSPV